MKKTTALRFMAGPGAVQAIRQHGFDPAQIGTIAGASGGAKWLVLSQLDRVVAKRILPALRSPVHLIGSSIGTWRFACYAQPDPLRAIERFEEAYLEQRYSDAPDIEEISTVCREMLECILGENGAEEVVNHPVLRMHVLTARARNLVASERPAMLGTGLVLAAMANMISRRSLGSFFVRSIFYDPRDLPPFFDMRGFPLERTPLTAENLLDSILASSAIPMVISGIRDIAGARAGTYRDGGIIDYHLDIPTSADDRVTWFPHFFNRLKPGWFDKKLSWRRHDPAHLDRTILLCPSDTFIARLPNGKIPDRTDFQSMPPEKRRKDWRAAVKACEELADELNDVLDKEQLPARLEPL